MPRGKQLSDTEKAVFEVFRIEGSHYTGTARNLEQSKGVVAVSLRSNAIMIRSI